MSIVPPYTINAKAIFPAIKSKVKFSNKYAIIYRMNVKRHQTGVSHQNTHVFNKPIDSIVRKSIWPVKLVNKRHSCTPTLRNANKYHSATTVKICCHNWDVNLVNLNVKIARFWCDFSRDNTVQTKWPNTGLNRQIHRLLWHHKR